MKTKDAARIIAAILMTGILMGCAPQGAPSAENAEKEMFTPRDKESGYDESTGTKITLNGEGATANSEAVTIVGKTVTLSDEGVYIISGSLKNGQIIVDADKTDKLQIVLNGVAITSADSAPLYIKQADKVFVTLAADSKNTLITDGDFKEKDGNNLDSVIYSKEDLTMNGKGTISVSTKYGHGITSKDDLAITGGAYDINVSNNGLAGKNSVRIADGTFKITSGKDGVHSENADDASLGYVYIAGGIFSISAGDDGIHAGANTRINGGTIDITKSEEGIEGESIDIAGGKISLVAADDGLNAASSASASADVEKKPGHGDFAADDRCYIKISGGTLYADAGGDGFDSNGGLYVTGGYTYVSGPENDGNSALDYNGNAEISGGVFVAAGSSGMAQNFGSSSKQGSMLVESTTTQSGEIVLKDGAGKTLASFKPTKKYSCVVISTPEIKASETYTLAMGGDRKSIKMTGLIYGTGGMRGGGPMGDARTDGTHQKPPGDMGNPPPKRATEE